MKGSTNAVNNKKGEVEMINLTLRTDQSSHAVLDGVVFTLAYGTITSSHTWNGSAMTLKVPAYVEYTITFGEVEGYVTPTPVTYTAQAGNARTIDVVYVYAVEILTVTVSGVSSGYTVSVVDAGSGTVIGSQTTSSKTYSIVAGTEYYVKGSSVSGYISPDDSETRTAVTGTHSITMKYILHAGTLNPENGVYIQDTDGYCHTESEWDGTFTPNGVAVITSNCRFVMSLENTENGERWSDGYYLVDGITTTKSESEAKTDYDGEEQTTTIINASGTSADIVKYCREYIFPNGQAGYLGAAGEYQAILDNKASVSSALIKCGGSELAGQRWTSTQYDTFYAWIVDFNDSTIKYEHKDGSLHFYARPLCSI